MRAATWSDWHQSDLPCQFTSLEAFEAREVLTNGLGRAFVEQTGLIRIAHPILKEWDTAGANAYLQLNSLASDLRLLLATPGIESVLADLREYRLCRPAWHLAHVAAMFERARPGAVVRFLEPGTTERPDAILKLGNDLVPLEAKLLTDSEEQEKFGRLSRTIINSTSEAQSQLPQSTHACVVLKGDLDSCRAMSDQITGFVSDSIRSYTGTPTVSRSNLCNVFIQPIETPPGLAHYQVSYTLAPVPPDENMRVLDRAKKASSQLRSLSSCAESGILAVGLNDYQDGIAVSDYIEKRMGNRHFRGISGLMVIKARTHLGPPARMNVDLIETRVNPLARRPLTSPIAIRPPGTWKFIRMFETPANGIRAYRACQSVGEGTGPPRAVVLVPDIRVLRPDHLQ